MAAWQKPENFAFWLLVILVITIILVSVIILFTKLYFERLRQEEQKFKTAIINHQEQLLHNNIKIQEQERTRIAADLHDGIISKLNVALLTLHTTKNIENASNMLQKNIELARNISHDLRPPLLEESSLQELIEDFLYPIQQNHKIRFYASQIEDNVPPDIKLQIFRIAQEVVNNTLKHAKAKQIHLHLRSTNNYIALQIKDDGIGFNIDQHPKGLGLKNIALRSEVLHGEYKFRSQLHKGTSFLFYLKHPFSFLNQK